ncbi:hypothetical protein B0H14DRAFT_2623213 [Mycena olivaceomarginata]|nr:hypothetical protein B0H14DRAFT_2623213 [Mycena olivaceomarginata]
MEAFDFPDNLPLLPPNPNPWSANVLAARQVLDNVFVRTLAALRKEDSEAVQYRVLSSNIIDNLVPVLEGMEGEEVPTGWVDSCAGILGPLVYKLQVMALAAEGIECDQIEFLQPHSGIWNRAAWETEKTY